MRIQVRASCQTKVWSEAENGEHETGERRYGRVRLARFARVRLSRYAKPISRNKPTVLQSIVTLFLLFAFPHPFSYNSQLIATVTRSLLGLNHGPQTSSAVTGSIAYCFYFQIYNAKDLAEEMAKIQTVLSDDKNDWEHRVAAVSLACVRTCTTVNPLLSPVLISDNPPSLPLTILH